MGARSQAHNDVSQPYKFTWRIENFSQLKETKYYSETFTIGSHKWKLLVFPNGNGVKNNYLSVYLEAVDAVELPCAEFTVAVVDQIDSSNTLRNDAGKHKFDEKANDWGFRRFIELKELKDPGKGYIVNDVCIVEVMFNNFREEMKSVEVVASDAKKDPIAGSIAESDRLSKLIGENVVEEVALNEEQPTKNVSGSSTVPSAQPSQLVPFGDYPNAGELFEDGKHSPQDIVPNDEKYENVGGFRILKEQALLYKKIWLKYGHIATSKILRDSYSIQITLVSELMTSLLEINQLSLEEMSSEKIEFYEFKIKMAENFEFNVKWLRDWLEVVKKDFNAEQNLKTALVMQDQCILAAVEQLIEAKDEFSKIQEKMSGIETTISTLLSGTQMKKRKVSRGLLFDGLF